MPGILDSSNPSANFVSNWELYRTNLSVADDLAHPELVPVLDLRKSIHGDDSKITLAVHRTAGAGAVTLKLYRKNNGSLSIVLAWQLIKTYANSIDEEHSITDLIAGEYAILASSVAGGTTIDIHVAVNTNLIL